MKKIVLLSFIIILNINSAYSQSTWFWQQPLPTGNFLYSVDFINANTGYAVGTIGTIMKTTNGGANWELHNINVTQYLSSVSVIDENTALTCNNNIYRTSNGGINWVEVYSNSNNVLFFLDFPSREIGYAAGGIGIILKSTNSGINWTQQTSPVMQTFFDLSFSDSVYGMAAALRGVLLTSNGGNSWNYTDFNLQQFDLVTSCSLIDSLNAYAVTTFGYIYKTTDGGKNWTNSILPNDFSNIPRQCSFANRDVGYIVTSFGNILKTTNASISWQTDSTFNPPSNQINVLYDVMALDVNTAFIGGAGGRVIKTTN
ncbi:MAG: YCF48-related protein, partial [Bacteroidota bacterium]|nr:YCF48-related protein [Bacteroidota bacterium]